MERSLLTSSPIPSTTANMARRPLISSGPGPSNAKIASKDLSLEETPEEDGEEEEEDDAGGVELLGDPLVTIGGGEEEDRAESGGAAWEGPSVDSTWQRTMRLEVGRVHLGKPL